jgi:PAS domain S-box-containing protein
MSGLEASEAAFHSAFTDAPVAMAFLDVGGDGAMTIRRPNRALVELLGLAEDQLIGRRLDGLVDAADPSAGQPPTMDASRAPPVHRSEQPLRHADGHQVWAQLHISRLDHAGEAAIALAHIVDISDRKRAEQARERFELQIELLSGLRLRLLRGERLRDALRSFCMDARDRTRARRVLLFEHNPAIEQVVVAASSDGLEDTLVPRGGGIERATTAAGDLEPGSVRISAIDPQLTPVDRATLDALDTHELLVAPLGDALAIAVLAPEGETISVVDEALFARVAVEVGEAVELAHARVERQRFDVLEDRERIATDLHDVVIQRLFAAGMRLQAAVPLVNGQARERLASVVAELDTTIAEIRDTIFSIHHPEREGLPLSARLAETVRANAEYLGFEPEVHIDGPLDEIVGELAEQVIPALTEILSNVARHAEATTVQIGVDCRDGALMLEVVDDGIGIDPEAPQGNGLGNLARRALALGGGFVATANPDAGGTVVRWWAGGDPGD